MYRVLSSSRQGQRLDKEFISWIPCVAGELFFSKTDHGLGSFDFYISNVSVQDTDANFCHRTLLASSVVDWQDTDIFSQQNRGLYRVVVVARSTDYRTLHGSVYLLEKNTADNDKLSYLRRFVPRSNCLNEQKMLESLQRLKTRFTAPCTVIKGSEDDQFLSATARQINQSLESIDTTVVHKIDFDIHRTGIMLSAVHYSKVHGLPLQRNHNERRRLCGQSFYYLKFLLHKHAHHSSDNETLTTVHGLKDSGYENAQVLVRDLKRGLVDAKRARKYTGHSASGIAAYGATLVRVCESMGWYVKDSTLSAKNFSTLSAEHDSDSEVEYLQNVGGSLELLDQEQANAKGQSATSRFAQLFTSSALWLFGVLGPLLVYINIFSNGYYSAIPTDGGTVERVKIPGGITEQFQSWHDSCKPLWSGFQSVCNRFTQMLVDYSSGVVMAAIDIMVMVLLLSCLSAVLLVRWGQYRLFEKAAVSYRHYLSRRAYSLKSNRSWHYRLAISRMFFKRLLVSFYQPKTSNGIAALWIAMVLSILVAGVSLFTGISMTLSAL